MVRAVIYARYSSDRQSEVSIEDQVRICTRLAEERGWDLVGTFPDHAISGASTIRRGYQALLESARSAAFDVVIAESIDRIARDQEHIASFYKRMRFAGMNRTGFAGG